MSASTIKVSELEGRMRLDAEYYQPHYLDMVKRFGEFKSLADYNPFILHPTEVKRVYEEDGLQLLFTQNIRDNRLDFSHVAFLPYSIEGQIQRNKLQPGDVVVTRTGANFGDAAPYDGIPSPIYASAHCIVIRCKDIPGAYLSTYFNTDTGKALLKRGVYGAAQPEISPEYIRTLQIPRFGEGLEKRIEQKLKQAKKIRDTSEQLYADAENLLASELGLDKLDLSESLFTIQSVSQVSESRRADAEYYKRKHYNLLGHIEKRKFSTLDQVASFSGGATPLGADYLDEGIPFLRIQNVGDNRLVMEDVAFIDESIHNGLLKRSQIQPDDVLLTITGRIGTSAVVSDDVTTGNINQHIVRMRLNTKEFNPYYLAAFMNSVGGRLQTERESYGTTRDALPYYCLAKIRVLHADMKLQKEIESTIRKAEETQKEAKRLLAEAKAEVERLIEGK